ncbi:probable potassium transporter 13 isoform X1 [Malus sylvestris]|uniref:probable potassium transporter 13 isoform X1 n=1 Tax=Malus domestica TaxID=3750 RepID=UPI0010AAF643|nr:probable potassium transporter 13 isoform X1 [Malus domestica]XP_050149828.1 probable potassium transporter 13 isoform X1 [Malus sylvestris]
MDPESASLSGGLRPNFYKTTLCLAYQSLGIVYGDLSISPIYVYKSTFSGDMRLYEEDHEILGVLSMVFWTLTIIPLCKYIIFVLGADDNGEGGTFALYSLLCRHSRMGLLNTVHLEHEHIPSYSSVLSTKDTRMSSLIRKFFEKHKSSKIVLLLVVFIGVGMIIGDGILTPTMSVLSAVYGIRIKAPDLHENYTVLIACIILVGLFALQHFGTHKVGFLFAPIMLTWLLCICGVGIYNIFRWNPGVIRALSPYYIYNFFKITGRVGWSSLGGIVLCITGTEAMFADLGHFSKLSIRFAFTALVYPCLVLAYMGEAAYLSKHKTDLHSSFYMAIPEVMFWPVFIIATLASVVGSQAIISATFSIVSQCRALQCFPRVKIKHTSNQIHGQIYIPEVNWMLMVLCLAVVIGFRDTRMIGHAYAFAFTGLAGVTVMFITTCLMFLIISTVWKQKVLVAFLFLVTFGSLELLYISACLGKVHHGGWLPLLFALLIVSLMSIWNYGTVKKDAYELDNKVSLDRLLSIGPSLGIARVPGICLVYSNVAFGLPPMFAHFVTNFPAFHHTLIFVTLKSLMIPKVPVGERFLVNRIGPPELSIFRCIVRYGYKDVRDFYNFETQLVEKVAEFLKQESNSDEMAVRGQSPNQTYEATRNEVCGGSAVRWSDEVSGGSNEQWRDEIGSGEQWMKKLMEAREAGGVAYMMGNPYVVASEVSPFLKKFAIDIVYGFLRRNCRRPAIALGIPHASLIEVGMLYKV